MCLANFLYRNEYMKNSTSYFTQTFSFLFFLFYILNQSYTLADGNPYRVGARSWGMANAVVARFDPLVFSGNIAGIAGTKEPILFSGFDSHYGFEGLNTLSIGGVIPYSKDLGIGFTVLRFGDKLYNESNISVGVGHKISRVSLGLKINYLQTSVNIPSFIASQKALVFEMGGIVQLSSKFNLGAHAYNLFQAKYNGDYRNELPTILKIGFQYEPIKALKISAELNKNTDLPISVLIGMEYQVIKQVFIRTGIASKPISNHFGAGFVSKKWTFDYAIHTNQQLGTSHHLSLGLAIGKAKKKELDTN